MEFLIAESYQAGVSCPFLIENLILSPFITRRQTNVYPSARRRKMRPFEGFTGKAIVVVPTDEEFQKRIEKRTKEEGKDVPEHAVLEMKGRMNIADSTKTVRQSHSFSVSFREMSSRGIAVGVANKNTISPFNAAGFLFLSCLLVLYIQPILNCQWMANCLKRSSLWS